MQPIPHVPPISRSDHLDADARSFLQAGGCIQTAHHSAAVAKQAIALAARFGLSASLAETAAWLHDISAVIPVTERVAVARQLGLCILPEEEAHPLILHQKLSAYLAAQTFGITDSTVLSAIECHTTLKKNPQDLDKIVFLADKIAWDQPGEPPYRQYLLNQLTRSLDLGVYSYLHYIWQRRAHLAVIHPWLRHAYHEFSQAFAHQEPDTL